MKIARLPVDIANKIAAGEVVERPASVVKELAENAVDAGAGTVAVEITEGGLGLIRVVDDGCGMDRDDAALAFERHATSKIRSAEELFHVQTLGFRGEALPSIASVSKLTLITREAGVDEAWSVYLEGGQIIKQGPCSHRQGTSVEVRELFFNTPARLKYLKSSNAESRRVEQAVEKLALANPAVSISLSIDGERKLTSPGDGLARSAARAVLGKLADRMTEARASSPGIEAFVLVAEPSHARRRRQDQFIIVNGRPVSSTAVFAAIDRGLEGVQMPLPYPPAVIWLEIDPSRVDVNVHPAKAEVRFADESSVFGCVRQAVSDAVNGPDAVPYIRAEGYDPQAPKTGQAWPASLGEAAVSYRTAAGEAMSQKYAGYLGEAQGRLEGSGRPGPLSAERDDQAGLTGAGEEEAPASRAHEENEARVIGQFMNTYIIAEKAGALLVIDQHVAHERILVDRFLRSLAAGKLMGQNLLMAITVELMPAEAAVLKEEGASLAELGFDVEPFGARSAIVRSVPLTGGSQPSAEALLLTALRDLAEGKSDPAEHGMRLMRTASEMACKGAVKAGMPLNLEQMEDITQGLFASTNPYRCPHGRPIMLNVDLSGIERGVGRRK